MHYTPLPRVGYLSFAYTREYPIPALGRHIHNRPSTETGPNLRNSPGINVTKSGEKIVTRYTIASSATSAILPPLRGWNTAQRGKNQRGRQMPD